VSRYWGRISNIEAIDSVGTVAAATQPPASPKPTPADWKERREIEKTAADALSFALL